MIRSVSQLQGWVSSWLIACNSSLGSSRFGSHPSAKESMLIWKNV